MDLSRVDGLDYPFGEGLLYILIKDINGVYQVDVFHIAGGVSLTGGYNNGSFEFENYANVPDYGYRFLKYEALVTLEHGGDVNWEKSDEWEDQKLGDLTELGANEIKEDLKTIREICEDFSF